MSLLGASPFSANLLIHPSRDVFSGTGSQTQFTMTSVPGSVNSVLVSIDGILQHDYTVSGNTLTFGFSPPVGTGNIVVRHIARQVGVLVPPSDSVSNAMIQTGAVTDTKLNITNLTASGTMNIGSGQFIKDSSGNIGIGVTPSGWGGGGYSGKVVEVGALGNSLWGVNSTNLYLMNNAYYNNGFKYASSNKASTYLQQDSNHFWYTAPVGTIGNAISWSTAMTLNSIGNLGVGIAPVSTPNSGAKSIELSGGGNIHSNSGSSYYQDFRISCNTYIAGGTYVFKDPSAGYATLYSTGNGAHSWQTSNATGTAGNAVTWGPTMTLSAVGALTTAAGINAGGNLMVGQTASTSLYLDGGYTAQIKSTINGSGGGAIQCIAGSQGVQLASGGTSWSSLSDETEKNIIEPISNAVEKVSSLRSVIGTYKSDEESKRRSFLIAQDVQAILPEAIDTNENGKLLLSYTDTIPLLVAAIKELNDRLASIEGAIK